MKKEKYLLLVTLRAYEYEITDQAPTNSPIICHANTVCRIRPCGSHFMVCFKDNSCGEPCLSNYSISAGVFKRCFVPYKKPPKAPKLCNVELHQWDKEKKISRHISTEMWNSPKPLCKWKKKMLEKEFIDNMNNPNLGYYFTIVRADKKTGDVAQSG